MHFSTQNICNAFRSAKWALEEGHNITPLTITELQCKQESINTTGQSSIFLQLFYDHYFQVAQEVEITSAFQKQLSKLNSLLNYRLKTCK